jgi:hypothetical protein
MGTMLPWNIYGSRTNIDITWEQYPERVDAHLLNQSGFMEKEGSIIKRTSV